MTAGTYPYPFLDLDPARRGRADPAAGDAAPSRVLADIPDNTDKLAAGLCRKDGRRDKLDCSKFRCLPVLVYR